MLKINIVNEFDENKKYDKTIKKILKSAYKHLGLREKTIINIVLVNNEKIKELNNTYRNIDNETDVLSFENTYDLYEIGDVFISIPKALSQAEEYKHSFLRELAFLSLHGFLHCLGYDHLNKEDETEMFKIQDEILEKNKFTR